MLKKLCPNILKLLVGCLNLTLGLNSLVISSKNVTVDNALSVVVSTSKLRSISIVSSS